jgi:hypothetical protein
MPNSAIDFRSPPASIALQWFVDAFAVWRRAPLKLSLLALAPLVAEGILQLIPLVGVVLSKFFVPILTFGLTIGIHDLMCGKPLRASCLFDGFRRERFANCAVLAVWTMSIFASQMLIAFLIYGPVVFDAVLLGHVKAHPELFTRLFTEVLIVPGIVLATGLMLAAPLMLFDGLAPMRAVVESVRRVFSATRPFLLFVLIDALIVGISLAMPWGLVLLLACLICTVGMNVVIWKSLKADATAIAPQVVAAQG